MKLSDTYILIRQYCPSILVTCYNLSALRFIFLTVDDIIFYIYMY